MKAIAAFLLTAFLLLPGTAEARREPFQPKHVLIFSHTTGYRHEAIGAAIPALSTLVRQAGGTPVATESPEIFTPKSLEDFDAVLLLSATTDPKDAASEWLTGKRGEALQRFARKGGGIIALHAAADSHYHSPWYAALIGGQFERHPAGTPEGRLTATDPKHRATHELPSLQVRSDEWYKIRNLARDAHVLLTLDPASIGEPAGSPWPISWTRREGSGRIFYTALGHTTESYSDPYFLAHLRGGIEWVLQKR